MAEHATAHLVVVDPAGPRPGDVISTLDIAAALSAASGSVLCGS